jgi:hypothetical protein
MAAGLGFKTFNTGDVLSAADTNGYLMQGIWVFANAAARDAAVTSPQEGNFAYLKDTNVTTYYTGSTWTNLDTTGMVNPMTTTGDTIYSSSGSTPARLGIGSTGQVLTVSGGIPSWATPASGSTFSGCVLTKSGNQTITAASYQAITFTTESIDTDSYHNNSTNTSRITIPSGKAGKYLICANFTYGNFNTAKYLAIFKNGSQIDCLIAWQQNSLTTTPYSMSGIVDLAVGDYVEVMAYSDIQSTTSNHTFAAALLGA